MDRLKCAGMLSLAAALAAPQAAQAGNGTFTGGRYNFCVSVRFQATPGQLASIRSAFTAGSQVLADATDGQQRFGRIRLVNDSRGSHQAEYWVFPQAGRAHAMPGMQFGTRGTHVTMYFPSDFTNKNGANGDGYTVAHEHAHHAWGVADEYSGPDPTGQATSRQAEDAPLAAESPTLNYSLMDNFFTRGGRRTGGAYTLNEFCTAANHDPDHNTWQHKVHGKSVWETIASHPTRRANPPTGLPVSAPPAPHTVDFADGSGMRNVVLLIDRSGSMNSEGRLAAAQKSAQQFIRSYAAGDGLGVASFSDNGTIDQPLAPVNEAARAAAASAVAGLAAAGSTNIGGGLLTALGQFTSQANRSCEETIVLLTDGEHNVGTPPEVGLAAAQNEEVRVLTVGLGGTISTEGLGTLKDLASQTGGNFYHAPSPSDLYGVFLELTAEASGQGLLARTRTTVAVNQPAEVPVAVEQGAAAVTFAIAVPDTQDVVELAVRSPSGAILRAATAGIVEPNSQMLTVNQPEAGTWTMVAIASAVSSGRIEAIAYADNPGVHLATAVAAGRVAFPAPVELKATPTFDGVPVVGAKVAGVARRPDGSSVPVELYDDGKAEHGDDIPGDGVYGARFEQYQGDGSYTFELRAENVSGVLNAGEALFADEPSNERPAPPFTRFATTTAVVSGVPDIPVVTVEYGPETLNFKSDEQFITVYVKVSGRYSASDIDPASVRITAVDSVPVVPLIPAEGTGAIVDVDQDGRPDLRLRLRRSELQALLGTGTAHVTLEGSIAGQPFATEWTPTLVNTGKPPR